MELAIQAISSHTENMLKFLTKQKNRELKKPGAILVDNSASLRMRFEQVKDFMLCLAEASDELTGPSGSWGLL